MFCPKCGKMNPDDREKCSGCGAVLHEEGAPAPKKKKNNAMAKIIAVIAALAVVAGGTAVAVTSCDGQNAEAAVFAEACCIIAR